MQRREEQFRNISKRELGMVKTSDIELYEDGLGADYLSFNSQDNTVATVILQGDDSHLMRYLL